METKAVKDSEEDVSLRAAGKVLVEVQNHKDGEFHIYADSARVASEPKKSLLERVEVLEARLNAGGL